MFTVHQAQQSKHPYSTVRVNGVPMKMMVDSGASVNVLGPEDLEHLSKQSKEPISLKKTNTKIHAFGENNYIPLLGKVETQ
jgi:predicted aspartyl protease